MTKRQALQTVALHLIGYLNASTEEEIADTNALSDADAGRIAWASEEIIRRLRKI